MSLRNTLLIPLLLQLLIYSAVFGQTVKPDLNLPSYIDSTATYIWPTNASDYFSATFAETRSAHFHAATDIGTWGREGYDVYAAREGELFRVGISPYGYGNVIYLRHNDGSFSVYAHLQDFEPGLRAIVDSLRFETYAHSFDQIMTDYGLHFEQGDFIGRTGSTGIGPPHLHFELRSPANAAFNPMLAGIHIADSVPPVFSSIAILPKSGDALINGRNTMITRSPSRSGTHFNFGHIDAEGVIALAVNASDRSDNGRNVYAVYELKMELNDQPFFHSRADSFPMEINRQMLLDRVYPLLQQRRGGFQRLHILPSNTLPFYNRNLGDGLLRLTTGTHTVLIRARDFYGNEATASLEIRVPDKPVYQHPDARYTWKAGIASSPAPVPEAVRPPVDFFSWSPGWIKPSAGEMNDIEIRSRGRFSEPVAFYETVKTNQTMPLSGDAVEIRSRQTGPFTLNRIVPGRETELRFPGHKMRLQFRENTVFDTTYVHVTRFSRKGRDYVQFSPGDIPLQADFRMSMTLPDSLANDEKTGLYYVNSRNGEESHVNSRTEGNQLEASVPGFGLFVVARDTTAPQISRPRLWRRSADQHWFVSVRVVDLQTGIDFNQAEFWVNGVRGIAEYDPFGHLLTYYFPGFRPARGANEISVTVSDRAGNKAQYNEVLIH